MLVLTTEAGQDKAEALARALLERRLVGCVSLSPIESLYRWEGELVHGREVQLLLKTTEAQLEALHQALHGLHSYDTPEWIVWPARASAAYGDWLGEMVKEREGELSPDAWPPAPAGSPGDEGRAG